MTAWNQEPIVVDETSFTSHASKIGFQMAFLALLPDMNFLKNVLMESILDF